MCFSAFYCLVCNKIQKYFLQKLYSYNNYPASKQPTYEENNIWKTAPTTTAHRTIHNAPGFKSWYFNQCPMVIILFFCMAYFCTKVFLLSRMGSYEHLNFLSVPEQKDGIFCLGRKKECGSLNAALYRVSQTFFMITAITYITYSLAFSFLNRLKVLILFVKFFLIVVLLFICVVHLVLSYKLFAFCWTL